MSRLCLYTNGFPFGKGEQFLETEIKFLAAAFDEVVIFPNNFEGIARSVPGNVRIEQLPFGAPFRVKLLCLRRARLLALIWKKEKKNKDLYKKRWSFYRDSLYGYIRLAEVLLQRLQNDNISTIHYSYWFGPWGTILSVAHHISRAKLHFVTRAHGYDYDIDQRKEGFIPYREFEMEMVGKVITVSRYGQNRIRKEYPAFKNLHLHRLGVSDHGINPKRQDEEPLRIVSCSSLIALKRVQFIIDVIERMNISLEWVHFGDGPLKEELIDRASALPPSVNVRWMGFVSNQEILDFYRTTPVDLFINVSELEGIPVSIMEAISFGIPSTGCNICGVPEIVNDRTGVLLEKEFNIDKAAEQLKSLLTDAERLHTLRSSSRAFWNEHYNAEVNYPRFINEILKE